MGLDVSFGLICADKYRLFTFRSLNGTRTSMERADSKHLVKILYLKVEFGAVGCDETLAFAGFQRQCENLNKQHRFCQE